MWNGQHVSVVLMTYAERDSIRSVIEGFLGTGVVDEVVVVDNNAEAGTANEVARTAARLVREPRQGYGHATRRGLLEATGERRTPGREGGRPAAVYRFASRDLEVTDPFAVLRPPTPAALEAARGPAPAQSESARPR